MAAVPSTLAEARARYAAKKAAEAAKTVSGSLGAWLIDISPYSDTQVGRLVKGGMVKVNGLVCRDPTARPAHRSTITVLDDQSGELVKLTFGDSGWPETAAVLSPTGADAGDAHSLRVAHLSHNVRELVAIIDSNLVKFAKKPERMYQLANSLFLKAESDEFVAFVESEYTAERIERMLSGAFALPPASDEPLSTVLRRAAWLRGRWLTTMTNLSDVLAIVRGTTDENDKELYDFSAEVKAAEDAWKAPRLPLPGNSDELDEFCEATLARNADLRSLIDTLLTRIEPVYEAHRARLQELKSADDTASRMETLLELMGAPDESPEGGWKLEHMTDELVAEVAAACGAIADAGRENQALAIAQDEARRFYRSNEAKSLENDGKDPLPADNVVNELLKFRHLFEGEPLVALRKMVAIGSSVLKTGSAALRTHERKAKLITELRQTWESRAATCGSTDEVLEGVLHDTRAEAAAKLSKLKENNLPMRERFLLARYEADLMELRGEVDLADVARGVVNELEVKIATASADETVYEACIDAINARLGESGDNNTPTSDGVFVESAALKATRLRSEGKFTDYAVVRKLTQAKQTTNADFEYRQITYLVTKNGGSGVEYALKKIPFGNQIELARSAANEIMHRTRLRHPGVHPVIEYFVDKDAVGILSQYHPNGSVAEWLDSTTDVPLYEKKDCARQIAQTLAYMHENNVVHGNLKLKNVLRTPNGRFEITDFGFSLDIYESFTRSSALTADLESADTAPEVVGGSSPTSASDVWSLGIMMYRMFYGGDPFPNNSMNAINVPEHENPRIPLLLQAMLVFDPDARPTVAWVLTHPFFAVSSAKDLHDRKLIMTTDVKITLFNDRINRYGETGQQLNINVNRATIGMDLLAGYSLIQNATHVRCPIKTSFAGESGIDAGGLTKDALTNMFTQLYSNTYDLFICADEPPPRGYTWLPNPARSDALHLFRNFGVAMLRLLIKPNVCIPPGLNSVVYKYLLGEKPDLSDLALYDAAKAHSLRQLLCTSGAEYFYLDFEGLKPGGASIDVTDDNKHEYVELTVHQALVGCREEILQSIWQGFHLDGMISDDVTMLTADELRCACEGVSHIDAEMVISVMDSSETSGRHWNWLLQIIRGFDENRLRLFVFFATATFSIPLGDSNFKIQISWQPASDRLPTSHNCYNQIDLPRYRSKEEMESKLTHSVCASVESGFSFG